MAREKDYSKIDKIFEATQRLVFEKGFAGIKLTDVARLSGIAIGTIYLYFKDKDDLVNQLYQYIQRKKKQDVNIDLNLNRPAEELIKELWMAYYKSVFDDLKAAEFFYQYQQSNAIVKLINENDVFVFTNLRRVLSKGIMEGTIKQMDEDILYTLLIGPIHELAKQALRNNFKATTEEKEELYSCLINSIKTN
ncbi:MAG: TetR/AcrR family transcriptional regulator [Bacteroidota bacterium]